MRRFARDAAVLFALVLAAAPLAAGAERSAAAALPSPGVAAPATPSMPQVSAPPAVPSSQVSGAVPAAAVEPVSATEVVEGFAGEAPAPSNFLWSPHGRRYLYTQRSARRGAAPQLRVVDLDTGRDRALFSGGTSARGSRSRAIEQIVWASDEARVAVVDAGTLKIVDVRTGRTRTAAVRADDPQFSPDGTLLSFVRDGDLYVADVRGAGEPKVSRLTFSGSESVLNGDPDWLYSEELDVDHAYRWSPKGDAIAYLQFDDRPVAPFPIQDFAHVDNTVEYQRYPLAGAANPKVSLRVIAVTGGRATEPDVLYDGAPHDEYLVSFAWTADGRGVVDEILDRAQHRSRLVRFDRAGGSHTIATENDPRFVDVQPAPLVLRDGRTVLSLSTRGGVQGLDRIDMRARTVRRLTRSIPVASLLGVDETRRVAYVLALSPTRIDRSLFEVALDGSRVKNLTPGGGEHLADVPVEGGRAFVERSSGLGSPPVIRRRPFAGGPGLILFSARVPANRALARTRAITIPSPEGPLDAALSVPANFDPAHRYPVVVTVYGGPLPVGDHFSDGWRGLEPTLLAQHGILTLDVEIPAERDDRTAYERTYSGAMGTVAIEGPRAAAAWLAQQPYVDRSRLGLNGYSYGGYLTAFTMTHSTSYRSGVAGAPPTDWRLYDTAYTERYLGKPQTHTAAYAASSVIDAAKNLSGTLLVVHGTSDDNVHLANTLDFVTACIRAGKPVHTFFLPGSRHGPSDPASKRYFEQTLLDWWLRTLAP